MENEIRVLRDESNRLTHEKAGLAERVKENHEKIKLNNQLPYLVGNIVEVLDVDPEEEGEEDGEPARLGQQWESWRGAGWDGRCSGAPLFVPRPRSAAEAGAGPGGKLCASPILPYWESRATAVSPLFL